METLKKIILLLFVISISILQADDFRPDEDFHRLQNNVIPLKTSVAGNGLEDLAPLKEILKDTRILAVGESTHGTREFFQCKHRMLEFFVKEMGCRCFAIEASYVECLPINEYVLQGKGDLNTVVAGQRFWTWNTKEVAEMVEWIRLYNLGVPESEKVQFLGFDCQFNANGSKIICEMIKENYPSYYDEIFTILSPIENFLSIFSSEYEFLVKIKGQVENASNHLAASISSWKGTSRDLDETLFLLNLIKQECDVAISWKKPFVSLEAFIETKHPELKSLFEKEGGEVFFSDEMISNYPELSTIFEKFLEQQSCRDQFMAENIMALLLRFPRDTPVVVWAHDFHVSISWFIDGISPMGSFLKDILGSKYYAVGFTTLSGTFQAIDFTEGGLKNFKIPSLSKGSWGQFCSQFQQEKFFLDFRSNCDNHWLNDSHYFMSIGSGVTSDYESKWEQTFINLVPNQAFDGVIFLQHTTAAIPTGTPSPRS